MKNKEGRDSVQKHLMGRARVAFEVVMRFCSGFSIAWLLVFIIWNIFISESVETKISLLQSAGIVFLLGILVCFSEFIRSLFPDRRGIDLASNLLLAIAKQRKNDNGKKW